jgi:hypothetical protein
MQNETSKQILGVAIGLLVPLLVYLLVVTFIPSYGSTPASSGPDSMRPELGAVLSLLLLLGSLAAYKMREILVGIATGAAVSFIISIAFMNMKNGQDLFAPVVIELAAFVLLTAVLVYLEKNLYTQKNDHFLAHGDADSETAVHGIGSDTE